MRADGRYRKRSSKKTLNDFLIKDNFDSNGNFHWDMYRFHFGSVVGRWKTFKL
jgi:hypothetical protein